MVIHFICTGNVYRSRLAEAYLKSKKIPGISVISSGIRAQEDRYGYIAWYAQRLIEKKNLIDYSKPTWTQTTKDLYKSGDITVFMTSKNFDRCVKFFGFVPVYYKIWDILDLDELGYFVESNSYEDEKEKLRITDKTYLKIKDKVDDLLYKIKTEKSYPKVTPICERKSQFSHFGKSQSSQF